MTFALVMIVRNEAELLPGLLGQVMPLVDAAVIVDTGSIDDTPEVAAGYGATVHHRPWVSFAHNRTEALQLAQGTADYHLMLDADHRIVLDGDRPVLSADSYMVRVRSGAMEWRLPLLTRDGHPFEYRGPAHAYLASDAPTRTESLDWITVLGGKGASRDKLERDRLLLEAVHDPTPRDVFYLARTYDDLDMPEHAIEAYRRRTAMNGWAQERFYARYRLGCLLAEHVSFAQGAQELMQAWREQPDRVEPLRALANSANAVADKADLPTDGLFVHTSAYRRTA